MTEPKTVDCRGLSCPQPVLDTQEALAKAQGPFKVLVDDEGSCTNVTRSAEGLGAQVSVVQEGLEFHLTITPGQVQAGPGECCELEAAKSVVYVSSQTMGSGDDQLGSKLLAVFLDTLSQLKGQISHALFVNSGAKLASQGSDVLEQLHQLEQTGVEILVCGTCLDHFQIKDKLAAGRVSNMMEIIETLNGAGRVIKP